MLSIDTYLGNKFERLSTSIEQLCACDVKPLWGFTLNVTSQGQQKYITPKYLFLDHWLHALWMIKIYRNKRNNEIAHMSMSIRPGQMSGYLNSSGKDIFSHFLARVQLEHSQNS